MDNGLSQVGERLKSRVEMAAHALERINEHSSYIDDTALSRVSQVVGETRARLQRSKINVCIVGEQKSGKSTFINALLGHEILGTAVRECTGSVTFISRGDRVHYSAQLVDGAVEDLNDKHRDRTAEYKSRMEEEMAELAECKRLVTALPAEIARLEKAIEDARDTRATNFTLQEATQVLLDSATAETEKQTTATRNFKSLLDVQGKEVPWAYRETGSNWNLAIKGTRSVMNLFKKPEWEIHFQKVKEYEAMKAKTEEMASERNKLQGKLTDIVGTICNLNNRIQTDAISLASRRDDLSNLPLRTRCAEDKHQSSNKEKASWELERLALFTETVRELTDMGKRGKDVEMLRLSLETDRIPEGVVLIDTPGVNTASEINQERAWSVIREQADACILVVDIGQALGESTREFLRKVSAVVPHVLLVLTKLDRSLENALLLDEDGEAEVAAAMAGARKRFANEMGRSEDEIITFGVSALPALKRKDERAVECFEAEIARLFMTVDAEKPVAIGMRCAAGIGELLRSTENVGKTAARRYTRRIDELCKQQILSPDHFVNEVLQRLKPSVRPLGDSISELLDEELRGKLHGLREQYLNALTSCKREEDLKKILDLISANGTSEITEIVDNAMERVDIRFGSQLRHLAQEAREPLLDRYRITQSFGYTQPNQLDIRVIHGSMLVPVSASTLELSKKVAKHIKSVKGWTLSAGAATGRAVMRPNLLSVAVAGAMIAKSLYEGSKLSGIKAECIQIVDNALSESIAVMTSPSNIGPHAITEKILNSLSNTVQQDTQQFRQWITSIIDAEKRELEEEERRLGRLTSLLQEIDEHRSEIENLRNQAATLCRNLSRAHAKPEGNS